MPRSLRILHISAGTSTRGLIFLSSNAWKAQKGMRKLISLSLILVSGAASGATALLTIQCEAPKGVREKYGLGLGINRTPNSHPILQGPSPDGYQSKLTFIVNPKAKKMTVLWVEAGADLEQRAEAKKFGLSVSPPPNAEQIDVITYSPNLITALSMSTYAYGTVTYSLYPKLGAMFMSYQYLEANFNNAVQSIFFAKCEFSGD